MKTLGEKKREEIPSKPCPGSVQVHFHDINIQFSSAPPPKLALILEGEEEYNDCKAVGEKPPIVTMERFASNQIGILVQHFGAYPELPRDVSFKLMNLGNCSVAPTEFMNVVKVPLEFVTSFPNGEKCGPRYTARLRLVKP